MYPSYHDITIRIGETPKWWINGVPRYCEFSPQAATVYANDVALVRTACQSCGAKFNVCVSDYGEVPPVPPPSRIRALQGRIGIKDPPNTGCCAAGASMMSSELQILQYWCRREGEWIRDKTMEIDLADGKTT